MTRAAATAAVETGEEFFARAKPNRRVVHTELVLVAVSVDEWTRLQNELTELKVADANKARLAGGGGNKQSKPVLAKQKEIKAVEERMQIAIAVFTLRAMPSNDYQTLKETNPPRKSNELDRLHGYNRDAVADLSVKACLVNPKFKDCEKEGCTHDPENGDDCRSFQSLQVTLNPTEWQELRDAADEANGAVRQAPKSQLPSVTPSRLANGSRRRGAGE
jgi:hypothetical protein